MGIQYSALPRWMRESIARGIYQSKEGKVRPWAEVVNNPKFVGRIK